MAVCGTRPDGYVSGRRIFAVAAALIMIAVVFQVMVKPVTASGMDDVMTDDWANPTVMTDAPDVDVSDQAAELKPMIDDQPGGSVESYDNSQFAQIDVAAEPVPCSHLSIDDNTLSYWTVNGIYVIDRINPAVIALYSQRNVTLVSESYFTLKSGMATARPSGGIILEMTDERFVVEYDVSLPGSQSAAVAKMCLEVEFIGSKNPKMTVKVVEASPSVERWNIVWNVVPAIESPLLLLGKEIKSPLSNYLSSRIPTSKLALRLASPVSGRLSSDVDINWTDAGEGVSYALAGTTLKGEPSIILQVEFSEGRAEIDPSLVATTTGTTPTELGMQRKVIWYGGYYWAFYDRGDLICYKSSADGSTWSSENVLPQGTALYAGYGFDVAGRGGKVIVSWVDSGVTNCYAKTGVILGNKILWNPRVSVTTLGACNAPVSVAIGTDESYYVFVQWRRNPYGWMWDLWRSFDGSSFIFAGGDYAMDVLTWNVICPFGNDGDVALIETTDSSTSVRVRYWIASFGGYEGWTPPTIYAVNMASGAKGDKFSAIASPDGTIHLAFKESSAGKLRYAEIFTSGYMSYWDITSTAISGYPSICLDANDDLHIFYLTVESGKYVIRHTQKLSVATSDWTTPDVFYAYSTTAVVKGLTAWTEPVGTHALLWTESNTQVKFGSIPLPYGTPGAQADPWSRDGLSPYGTYFSTHGDYISPGSGLLTLTETDVSIKSRAGMDLGISRLYMQPRYFRISDGTPYMPAGYPYCNLGPGWSLDLPWMDKNYIGVPGGQRFIVMWGNTGNPDVFENHDGMHFTLRDRTQSTPHGPLQYYELILTSGMRYCFDHDNYKLIEISDLRGYDIDSSSYSDSYNIIWINYDYVNNRIQSIEESDLGRMISFTYNANGNLWKITRPDTSTFTFSYTSYGGTYYLTSVTDPQNRVTSYTWAALGVAPPPVNYVIKKVTFPTGGVNDYRYTVDNTPATEARSWLVTSSWVNSSVSGPVIRKADYDYRIVNGRVIFCKATDKNEAQAIQGFTEYIFQSSLKYTSETKKDSSGVQMARADTWYDNVGQPVRVDTYRGSSESAAYSEYTGYDDWGNVIFTRDALGHESYSSYANTNTKNSFQGGSVLTRTTSGKIFYDAFDDWNMDGWNTILDVGNTVTIDGSDDPMPPAIKLSHVVSGAAIAYHSFAAQSTDFIIQTSFKTSGWAPTYIEGKYDGSSLLRRFCFFSLSGSFYWWDGSSHQITEVSCAYNTWYDIAFYIHYATDTYQIFIDGQEVSLSLTPTLVGTSGNIDSVLFQAGDIGTIPTYQWVDDVRVYRSLAVSVSGASGYITELCDSRGDILDRSKSGTLNVPAVPLHFPPGYIRMSKEGFSTFETPMMDIWGGDEYTLSAGYSSSSVPKTTTGYKKTWGTINDEYPFPGTTISNGDLTWVNDADYAVNSNWYHESAYESSGSHYHGFDGAPGVGVYTTHVITQYIWLTEGKLPQEIAVQFKIDGVWKRAYWGGTSSIIDVSSSYTPNQILRVDDVPQTTGKWLELTVLAYDLGITTTSYVTGVLYALYSGTARWDFTAQYSRGLYVYGLSEGQKVELYLDDGTYILGVEDTAQPVILDLYGNYERVFPISGYFKILSTTSTLLYESPRISEIWNLDVYTYSSPEFYANEVKWLIRDRQVGSFEYQDYAKTAEQKSYINYDNEGNAVLTRSKLGTGWISTGAGFDEYGNQLWSSDPTGRKTFTRYLLADMYTYPNATSVCGNAEYFDTVNGWTNTTGASWMTAKYTAANQYSPTYSTMLSFSGATSTSTYSAALSKEYIVTRASTVSLRMNLDTYIHNNDSGASMLESMDSGLRLQLYNSGGTIYATYTYWLACWSQGSDNKSNSDPTIKVIFGTQKRGVWRQVMLYPELDWNIDWSVCAKIKFEFYVTTTYATGDSFKIYYDDFATDSTTTSSYDLQTGNLLVTKDPLGRKTNYSYDKIGRVIWTQNADGSRKRTVYDDVANTATAYDESNHRTVKYFDKIGRNWKSERFAGSSANYSWIKYTYNWQDQVSSHRDALGHVTSTTYDYLGRATRATYPDLHYALTTYNDAQKTIMYEYYNVSSGLATHRLIKTFDDLDRLNKTTEFKDATTSYDTLMTYDAVGNPLTVKDARSDMVQVTRMSYDSLNRLTRGTYPDGYSDNVSYDGAGRVICKMDREGNLTFTAYDPTGRIARVVGPADTLSYKYDAADQGIEARNSLGTITYGYNLRGMMSTLVQSVVGSNTYSVSFLYNSENRVTSITYPDATVNYLYDWLDRVRDVQKGSTQVLNITYNVDDTVATEKTGETNSNYVKTTTYTYTNRDWIDTIVMKRKTTTKLSLDYNYDDVGNVVRLTDVLNNKVERYTYDWMDRLTSASGGYLPSGLTYTFDAVGNRLTCGSTSYTYGLNNKLTSDSTWTYLYDPSGNLAHRTKAGERWDYSFNSLDQLTNVAKNGASQGQFKYDANGMRANTTVGTTYADFVFNGHDPLLERSKTGSTATTTDYVYVNGGLKFTLVGAATNYYFGDAVGSIRQIWQYGTSTTPTFSVQTYKPFGATVGVSGTDQKWKYTGEMLDSTTGLYYIGARYMDPELGRFISLDPNSGTLSEPQSINRYVYCVNNPLRFTDPTGRMFLMTDGGGGGDSASENYKLYPYGSIGIGYEYDTGHIVTVGGDASVYAVVDIYHWEPVYASIKVFGINLKVLVAYRAPTFYYLNVGAGIGFSTSPQLQFEFSLGPIPVTIGGGAVLADLTDPKNYRGWYAQIGPWTTGGEDLTFSPDIGFGAGYTWYLGTGYCYVSPIFGLQFTPPTSWLEDIQRTLSSMPGPTPLQPSTPVSSGGYGGGGGGRFYYC